VDQPVAGSPSNANRASVGFRVATALHFFESPTGWSTGYPQRTGDSFEIDFGESLDFRKIELRLGTNPLDYPRDFIVESSADGRVWSRLSGRKGFFPPVDLRTIEDVLKYAVPIPVAPTTARKLRITLTGPHPERHWSINEIAILN
jgi:hypothetical protein